jgi:anti-sigma regulatory factor (Ser/Thr protein kinase)
MTPTYQRTLRRELSAYLPVAEEVEAFCAQHGLPTAALCKVRVVLEELVLNQIDHATGAASDRIDLRIDLEPSRVVIVLEDDAAPFDPRSRPAFDKTRPLEERTGRGMGLQLVRSMTEELDYERAGTRNRLRVVIASRGAS